MDRDDPKARGAEGEQIAARYLAARGMRVLDRNWRGRDGELDIVAQEPGGALVVVEVKTRAGEGFGGPAQAVTASKYARLRRLAAQWAEGHAVRCSEIRIDVVAVILEPGAGGGRVEHLKGAFR
jgi:putative endonuclease